MGLLLCIKTIDDLLSLFGSTHSTRLSIFLFLMGRGVIYFWFQSYFYVFRREYYKQIFQEYLFIIFPPKNINGLQLKTRKTNSLSFVWTWFSFYRQQHRLNTNNFFLSSAVLKYIFSSEQKQLFLSSAIHFSQWTNETHDWKTENKIDKSYYYHSTQASLPIKTWPTIMCMYPSS